VFALVAILSFLAVEFLLVLAEVFSGFAGGGAAPSPNGEFDLGLTYLLALVATIFVGAFFTIPATLAMFGHGGTWVKHVAAKSAKYLSLALVFAFAPDLAGVGMGALYAESAQICIDNRCREVPS
jgi:hypothetical protein